MRQDKPSGERASAVSRYRLLHELIVHYGRKIRRSWPGSSLQVFAGISSVVADEGCCVQPLLGGHMQIAERSQPRLRRPGRGTGGRIVPEQHVPVDGALA